MCPKLCNLLSQSHRLTSPSCRVEAARKNGVPALIRVLASVESDDPTSADAITSVLRMLVPQPDKLCCKVRAHQNFIRAGLL